MTGALVYGTSAAIAIAIAYGMSRAILGRKRRSKSPAFGLPPPEIRILSRARVSMGRSLLIVEVEGRRLLLGSSSGEWATLADLGHVCAPGEEGVSLIDSELARALRASSRRGRGFHRN